MAELNTMYEGVTNSPDTFLTSALASGGTVLYVADGSVFGTLPNLAVLGSGANAETILVVDKRTDNGYNIQRAVEGLARDWPQATIAARNFTNYDYQTLIENVQALNIGKVEKETGKGLSTNDYDSTAKSKVDAIPPNPKYTDTVYTHPSTHPASMITESSTKRFVSETEKNTWSGKQDKLTAGENISINTDNQISATDTKYTAGTNITISENKISAIDTKYTAGENITIEDNVISSIGGSGDITLVSQYDVPKTNGFSGHLRVYLFSNGLKFLYALNLTRSSASNGIIAGVLPDEYKPLLSSEVRLTGVHRTSTNAYNPAYIALFNDQIWVHNPNSGDNGIICTGLYL